MQENQRGLNISKFILECICCGAEFELTPEQYDKHYTDYCKGCFAVFSDSEDDSPWE